MNHMVMSCPSADRTQTLLIQNQARTGPSIGSLAPKHGISGRILGEAPPKTHTKTHLSGSAGGGQ